MHENAPDREALARAIAEVSLLRGTFTLRSGRTSSYYLDKYRFSTRPEILAPLAAVFAARVAEVERDAGHPADRLAGAELGGIPLVTATALRTGHATVFIRNQKKDYGTSQRLEGELNDGDRVIFVEDVATTAGQSIEAADCLRQAGARVLAVICAVDREEGARANVEAAGIRFESLFTKTDLGVSE